MSYARIGIMNRGRLKQSVNFASDLFRIATLLMSQHFALWREIFFARGARCHIFLMYVLDVPQNVPSSKETFRAIRTSFILNAFRIFFRSFIYFFSFIFKSIFKRVWAIAAFKFVVLIRATIQWWKPWMRCWVSSHEGGVWLGGSDGEDTVLVSFKFLLDCQQINVVYVDHVLLHRRHLGAGTAHW